MRNKGRLQLQARADADVDEHIKDGIKCLPLRALVGVVHDGHRYEDDGGHGEKRRQKEIYLGQKHRAVFPF